MPALALARQHGEQADERHHRQQRQRARPRRRRRPARPIGASAASIVKEIAASRSPSRGGMPWASQARASKATVSIAICAASASATTGQAPSAGSPGASRPMHERRPEGGPGVAEVQQQVVRVGAAAQVVRQPDEHVGGDPDRDGGRGREHQEGGDDERLRGRAGERADGEAHAAGQGQQREQQRERGPGVLAARGQPCGERGDRPGHRERARELRAPVAGGERLGRAPRGRPQQRLEPRIDVEGSHPRLVIGFRAGFPESRSGRTSNTGPQPPCR